MVEYVADEEGAGKCCEADEKVAGECYEADKEDDGYDKYEEDHTYIIIKLVDAGRKLRR